MEHSKVQQSPQLEWSVPEKIQREGLRTQMYEKIPRFSRFVTLPLVIPDKKQSSTLANSGKFCYNL